jgi:hypothetical protein
MGRNRGIRCLPGCRDDAYFPSRMLWKARQIEEFVPRPVFPQNTVSYQLIEIYRRGCRLENFKQRPIGPFGHARASSLGNSTVRAGCRAFSSPTATIVTTKERPTVPTGTSARVYAAKTYAPVWAANGQREVVLATRVSPKRFERRSTFSSGRTRIARSPPRDAINSIGRP